jgi:membrane protein
MLLAGWRTRRHPRWVIPAHPLGKDSDATMIERLIRWGLRWVERILKRLTEMEFIDRSLALGATAFSALIPLLVVLAYLTPHNEKSFAKDIVRRFGLTGSGADAVRSAFSGTGSGTTLSILSVLIVIFSALSFARRLQRIFELSWDLPRLGVRYGTVHCVRWLLLFTFWIAIHPLLPGVFHGRRGLLISIVTAFALWLVTPRVLLAGRVAWRSLVPQAALTAIGMVGVEIGAAIYVPRQITKSAQEYGAIGVAFTLLSVLWAAGFVVVISAALGTLWHAEHHQASQDG